MAAAEAALMLHGQPGSARDWDRVVAELNPKIEAIAIDRPGWSADGTATDVAGNTAAAVAALDERKVDRATVVGHSFGGTVAASLALTHPERVEALVLLAPAASTAALLPIDRLLAAPVIGPVMTVSALAGSGLALLAPALRRRVAGALELDEQYLRATAPTLLRPAAWKTFVAEQRFLVQALPALEARLGEISVPTTIVCGADDRVVPLAAARALARLIPDAELVVLERAGHMAAQSQPARVAQLIADALAMARTPEPSDPLRAQLP